MTPRPPAPRGHAPHPFGLAFVLAGATLVASAACDDSDSPRAAPAARGLLPGDYVIVGPEGASVFTAPPKSQARDQAGNPAGNPARNPAAPPPARVGPGFGFAVTDDLLSGGHRFLHLADGRWLDAADVTRARRSRFAGAPIAAGPRPLLAWVVVPEAAIRTAPSASAPIITTRPAHARLAPRSPCAGDWCQLDVGWISSAQLAAPSYPSRPLSIGPLERWLDIDLSAQVLVAYQGDRPVYATLVSTGVGQPGSPFATPTGLFRILAKRELVRMDNLEHTGVVPYAYDVPLAQYFTDGKALHAALWHDRFGQPTSHGCVNLAPADAEWLFAFTSPTSPGGKTRAAGTAAPGTAVGTAVRVRGELPSMNRAHGPM